MCLPVRMSDIALTMLKVEGAVPRREIDVIGLYARNATVRVHIDEKTLHALMTARVGLHHGGLLTAQADQSVAVELPSITRTATLILDRQQLDDLRDQCRAALGELHFGDLKNHDA